MKKDYIVGLGRTSAPYRDVSSRNDSGMQKYTISLRDARGKEENARVLEIEVCTYC